MGRKPVCATCRHFQPSPNLSGTGWCKHPKHDKDDMVLVRSTELACKVLSWPGNGHWEEAREDRFNRRLTKPQSEPLG